MEGIFLLYGVWNTAVISGYWVLADSEYCTAPGRSTRGQWIDRTGWVVSVVAVKLQQEVTEFDRI